MINRFIVTLFGGRRAPDRDWVDARSFRVDGSTDDEHPVRTRER